MGIKDIFEKLGQKLGITKKADVLDGQAELSTPIDVVEKPVLETEKIVDGEEAKINESVQETADSDTPLFDHILELMQGNPNLSIQEAMNVAKQNYEVSATLDFNDDETVNIEIDGLKPFVASKTAVLELLNKQEENSDVITGSLEDIDVKEDYQIINASVSLDTLYPILQRLLPPQEVIKTAGKDVNINDEKELIKYMLKENSIKKVALDTDLVYDLGTVLDFLFAAEKGEHTKENLDYATKRLQGIIERLEGSGINYLKEI